MVKSREFVPLFEPSIVKYLAPLILMIEALVKLAGAIPPVTLITS